MLQSQWDSNQAKRVAEEKKNATAAAKAAKKGKKGKKSKDAEAVAMADKLKEDDTEKIIKDLHGRESANSVIYFRNSAGLDFSDYLKIFSTESDYALEAMTEISQNFPVKSLEYLMAMDDFKSRLLQYNATTEVLGVTAEGGKVARKSSKTVWPSFFAGDEESEDAEASVKKIEEEEAAGLRDRKIGLRRLKKIGGKRKGGSSAHIEKDDVERLRTISMYAAEEGLNQVLAEGTELLTINKRLPNSQ